MNTKLILTAIVLFLSMVVGIRGCIGLKKENKRLAANQQSLLTEHNSYVQLSEKEMKRLSDRYEQQLLDLKLKMKDVKQVSDYKIKIQYDTVRELKIDTVPIYVGGGEKIYRKYTAEYPCFKLDILATEEPIVMPIDIQLEFNHFIVEKRIRLLGITLKRKPIRHEFYSECGLDVSVNTVRRLE
jgi:hypothetical protein